MITSAPLGLHAHLEELSVYEVVPLLEDPVDALIRDVDVVG